MSENRISEEHSNPQSRHALGHPMGTPALSSHHVGAAFSQIPFAHPSLFPMMPTSLGLAGNPFAVPHQNKGTHGINDMGPPMFSIPLNLGVPGHISSQTPSASMPCEGFNPDSLLAPTSRTSSKIISKLSAPSNNYTTVSSSSRPDSPNKKKVVNTTVSQASPKPKPIPLPLSNSHIHMTTHQSTSGVTTGNNNSNSKSAFSVVMPLTTSSSGVKDDGDMISSRNKFLKSGGGTKIDIHSYNNSNEQFRVAGNAELHGNNNLHWKQLLQNSCNTSSTLGSKALSGSHAISSQVGGVTEASVGTQIHNKAHNNVLLAGTSLPSMDGNRSPPTSAAWSSVTHPHDDDKTPHPPPTVVTNVTRAMSSNATTSMATTLSSATTTLLKPLPQWPSRDHMVREINAVTPAEADCPRSNSQPLPSTIQQSVNQSPTSNRPSILRKRPVDSIKKEVPSYSKISGGRQSVASPTNGFLDYHGNQSPASLANESALNFTSNSLRLEDCGPDFMSPRKKPRKQLVNPTEDHYASNIPSSNTDTPTRSHGRDESTPSSLPSESQSTTQDKSPESIQLSAPLHRSPYSVCSNYKPYTKAAHSHFWRYTDVRVKEDSKQQSMSFLSGKSISKQATGWKLSRVQHHLDDVDKLEQQILETTLKLQQRLDNVSSNALPCSDEELKTLKELVQGNIDRSNRAVSETAVVKDNMAKVLTHKSKAMGLVQRYQAYRQHNTIKHPKRRKTH